jgi:hypothetical protein
VNFQLQTYVFIYATLWITKNLNLADDDRKFPRALPKYKNPPSTSQPPTSSYTPPISPPPPFLCLAWPFTVIQPLQTPQTLQPQPLYNPRLPTTTTTPISPTSTSTSALSAPNRTLDAYSLAIYKRAAEEKYSASYRAQQVYAASLTQPTRRRKWSISR